jgi:ElaB/YqjD/DUF883 family membrane-anchored ribosome-binding protein
MPTQATPGNPGARPSDLASAKDNATDALRRGKEGLSDAASMLASDVSSDLESLRRDLNNLKDTVSRFISRAGVVSSSVAGDLAESGANVASAARDQAKTFTSELEIMGRRNPLGAMAAAMMVGMLIGLVSRRRSSD